MAQHAVKVENKLWARVNLAAGGEFTLINNSDYVIHLFYSSTDISGSAPTAGQLQAAAGVDVGDYAERITTAGVMDAYVTLAQLPRGLNDTDNAHVTVIEP